MVGFEGNVFKTCLGREEEQKTGRQAKVRRKTVSEALPMSVSPKWLT
jgi:hypothetical protein